MRIKIQLNKREKKKVKCARNIADSVSLALQLRRRITQKEHLISKDDVFIKNASGFYFYIMIMVPSL